MRKFLRDRLPSPDHLKERFGLHIFGSWLHEPGLWHVTHRAAARGLASGLFCAFIPLPVQTLAAVVLAVLVRGNLPLAVLASLCANPLTMPMIYFLSYRLGAWLLSMPGEPGQFEFSLAWFGRLLSESWQPLLLGCTLLGTLSAALGYYGVQWLWKIHAMRLRRTKLARRPTPTDT